MIRVSVSNLDLFRSYQEDEEYPLEVFLAQLRGDLPSTPAMERGHAFALAMENAKLGEANTLTAEGHTFAFTCEAEIEAWPRREEKREKDYGGVIVSARCDRILGRIVADDKTTEKFDPERYFEKFQWRYYLDLWNADVFRWHVWECKEIEADTGHAWEVYAHHLLTQYRYPDLGRDCRELAQEFRDFAEPRGLCKITPDKSPVDAPSASGGPTEPPAPQELATGQQDAAKWRWYGVADPNGNLLAVSYEPVEGILGVKWKKGEGRHYGVPEALFLELRRVPYAYKTYKQKIQGQYRYEAVPVDR